MSILNNRPLNEIYAEIAHEWADSDAAATLLEDTKSSFLSQRMQDYVSAGHAVNKAEMLVKASQEWVDRVTETVEARRQANHLKVRLEQIRMRSAEQQSEQANERLQARL